MQLKPGSRWKSAVCTAEVVVVRPPKAEVSLESGGSPMVGFEAARPEGFTPDPRQAVGVAIGKRYIDADSGLEVLVNKAGAGPLSASGRPLQLKDAKALPASD